MKKTKKSLAVLLAAIIALFSCMSLTALAATPDVSITKSSKAAADPNGKQVNYLESMTFTLPDFRNEYNLYLYIDSQIMGVQFCDGKGTAASNNPDKPTKYKAILRADWTKAKKNGDTITPEASLSCFVDAMGGVEFGAKLFTGMTVKKAANGDYTATLHFTDDATLVIYTVNAHTFVNADKSPVGFYDAAGKLHTTKTTSAVHTDQSTVPENLKDAQTSPEDGGERLNVFDKILAFFRSFINFFKNLFKK